MMKLQIQRNNLMLSHLTRTTGRQRNRANPQVTDTKDYWRITLYYQFLDHLLNELRDHLMKNEDRFLAQLLILINLNKLKQYRRMNCIFMMLIEQICKPRQSLLLSKQNGKQGGNYITEEVTPIHLCETLELVNKTNLHPKICCMLKIVLTMPPPHSAFIGFCSCIQV